MTTVEREFTLTYEGVEYTVEAEAEWTKEMYGCDADGNRGELRACCEVTDFSVFDEDGNDVTFEFSHLDDEVNKYMGDNPPEEEL